MFIFYNTTLQDQDAVSLLCLNIMSVLYSKVVYHTYVTSVHLGELMGLRKHVVKA